MLMQIRHSELLLLRLKGKNTRHVKPELEASLRMVAPGAGIRGGTLHRPKYRWRPKKKVFAARGVGFQSESTWWPKKKKKKKRKKGLCLPNSGFSVSKEKKNKKNKWCHPKMVTPGAGPPQRRHFELSPTFCQSQARTRTELQLLALGLCYENK